MIQMTVCLYAYNRVRACKATLDEEQAAAMQTLPVWTNRSTQQESHLPWAQYNAAHGEFHMQRKYTSIGCYPQLDCIDQGSIFLIDALAWHASHHMNYIVPKNRNAATLSSSTPCLPNDVGLFPERHWHDRG